MLRKSKLELGVLQHARWTLRYTGPQKNAWLILDTEGRGHRKTYHRTSSSKKKSTSKRESWAVSSQGECVNIFIFCFCYQKVIFFKGWEKIKVGKTISYFHCIPPWHGIGDFKRLMKHGLKKQLLIQEKNVKSMNNSFFIRYTCHRFLKIPGLPLGNAFYNMLSDNYHLSESLDITKYNLRRNHARIRWISTKLGNVVADLVMMDTSSLVQLPW